MKELRSPMNVSLLQKALLEGFQVLLTDLVVEMILLIDLKVLRVTNIHSRRCVSSAFLLVS